MTHKGFDIDLLEGKAREDAFARVLLSGRELVEHKRDFKCMRTGNLALEYETSTLPKGEGDRYASGIAVCEAHWFVLEYDHEKWLVWTLDEVKAIARRAIRSGLHKWVGDNDRFHNALVPIEWFTETKANLRRVA